MLEKLFSSILQKETIIVRKEGRLYYEQRRLSVIHDMENNDTISKPLFPISKVRK